MRTMNIPLLLLSVIVMMGCHYDKGVKDKHKKENMIISKVHHKTGHGDVDTLWISQNDSTAFRKEELLIHRPDRYPEFSVRYVLLNPKDGAYYFIYNDKKQLVEEGKYSAQYTYEGITYDQGNFYNLKRFSYKKNGHLQTIHYQEDGRNLKTEFFAGDGQLTQIKYFNKKSSDIDKVEIYRNGKLKETRIYKGFNTYDVVKAGE